MSKAPCACIIKLFTTVVFAISCEARVFATASYFHLSLVFVGKARAYLSGDPYKGWNLI
jgi:hypothetical protein